MTRQSVTLTEPNDHWLNAQVESKEYGNKSEVINALIRKARAEQQELEFIRAKLLKAEQAGFTAMSPEEIKAEARKRLPTHDL
jgi:antitoxin ParD1/3/4